MARGAVRGALGAWLGLVALQVATTSGGSGRIAGAFGVLNGLVERALDPNVPAIPDGARAAVRDADAGGDSKVLDGADTKVVSPAPPNPSTIPLPGLDK
jgi:hypothetical protein